MTPNHTNPSAPTTATGAYIILAGGLGSRMGANGNKVFLEVDGKPILAHSLHTADQCDLVHTVVLVVRDGEQDQAQDLLDRFVRHKPTRMTVGGATRGRSEHRGVEAVAELINSGQIREVAIHDGARPFASRRLIDEVFRTLSATAEPSGALPGLEVTEELYHLDQARLLRSADHRWAQTPQGFDARTLLTAHRAAAAAGFDGADTIEVVDRFGEEATGAPVPVTVLTGEASNLKVTFPDDLDSRSLDPSAGTHAETLQARLSEALPPEVVASQAQPTKAQSSEVESQKPSSPTVDLVTPHTARLTVPDGCPLPTPSALALLLHDLPPGVGELLVTRAHGHEDLEALQQQRAATGVAAVFTTRSATQAIKEVGSTVSGSAVPLRRSLDRTRVAVIDLPQLIDRARLTATLRDNPQSGSEASLGTRATDDGHDRDPRHRLSPAALLAQSDPTQAAVLPIPNS